MRKTSGISLILLIFLSLCLTIFSLLSLSGSTADEKLSAMAADRTTEYYAAVSEANGQLARIDALLAGYLRESAAAADQETAWLQLCSGLPEALPEISWTEDGGYSFTVPVTDTQVLLVTLDLSYPAEGGDTLYRITAWKTVNTRDWKADTSQNLLQIPD